MKQAIEILPHDAEKMALDLHAELEPFEAKLLGADHSKLHVDFEAVRVSFPLFDVHGCQWSKSHLCIKIAIERGERFSLSSVLTYRLFKPENLRDAYVLARRLAHQIEDSFILQAPHAPFHGITQNFDFRVDVPKAVTGYEAGVRSIILVRR